MNTVMSLLPTALALGLLPYASAQQSNISATENCNPTLRRLANNDTALNATGSAAFRLGHDEDWYLSYSLTDRRHENLFFGDEVTSQDLGVYLSVPASFIGSEQGNGTRFCMYMMPGRNRTSEEGGGSCAGVVSDECLEAMRSVPPPEDGRCPRADIREQCNFGTHVGRGDYRLCRVHLPR